MLDERSIFPPATVVHDCAVKFRRILKLILVAKSEGTQVTSNSSHAAPLTPMVIVPNADHPPVSLTQRVDSNPPDADVTGGTQAKLKGTLVMPPPSPRTQLPVSPPPPITSQPDAPDVPMEFGTPDEPRDSHVSW